MKAGTTERIKFKRLQRALQLPLYTATGVLESIWYLTARDCPHGDIGKYSNEDIAAAIEYPGDADDLVAALVESGWLDRCSKHRLVVHDWRDHAPRYVHGLVARSGDEFATAQLGTTVAHYSSELQSPTTVGNEPGDSSQLHTPTPSLVKSSLVKSKEEGESDADASDAPPSLIRFLEFWNSLERPKVVLRHHSANPPAKEVLKAWRRGWKDQRVRELMCDPERVVAAARDATFAHGEGWFTVPGILTKNKAGEWKILQLVDGAYVANGKAGPTKKRVDAKDVFDASKYDEQGNLL